MLPEGLWSHTRLSSLLLLGSTLGFRCKLLSPIFSWILLQPAPSHLVVHWIWAGRSGGPSHGELSRSLLQWPPGSQPQALSSTAPHPCPPGPDTLITETIPNPPHPLPPQSHPFSNPHPFYSLFFLGSISACHLPSPHPSLTKEVQEINTEFRN